MPKNNFLGTFTFSSQKVKNALYSPVPPFPRSQSSTQSPQTPTETTKNLTDQRRPKSPPWYSAFKNFLFWFKWFKMYIELRPCISERRNEPNQSRYRFWQRGHHKSMNFENSWPTWNKQNRIIFDRINSIKTTLDWFNKVTMIRVVVQIYYS